MSEDTTYTASDWPHGLRCGKCERGFVEGEPVRSVLLSIFEDGTPVEMVVCGTCEISGEDHAREKVL